MSTQVIVAGPRNGLTVKKIEEEIFKKPLQKVTSSKSYKGQKSIVIEGFDFRGLDQSGGKQLSVTDCVEVTVRRCAFGKKHTLGQGLNITGSKTKRVIVEYCLFEDMTFTESNGGEPCRLGNSQFSGISFECIVRKSIYRNLKSDPEVISVKSCRNTIEDCFFLNNRANVTVRHGGLTTIQHNYFQKLGGIRLHGYGNKALYNCFEDFGTDDGFAPIIVRYGNKDKDPNFKDVKTPSEKAASDGHAIYAQTVDNEIDGNEFKNCKKTIVFLAKGASLKPVGTKTGKNPNVEQFKFGSAPPVQPEPTPVEPQPEPVPEVQPEQPEVTPQPDDVSATRMCGIRKHEEAKVHLSMYACAEHAPILIEKFKQLLRETEAEIGSS